MPDGRRIVFGGNRGVYWQLADGSGTAEFLGGRTSLQLPTSISPDGSRILFHGNPTGDIMVLSMEQGREVRPLFETQFGELLAEISPNGKWVAYEATDSGQPEIYVRPFPDTKIARWQVSTGGYSTGLESRRGGNCSTSARRER